MEGRSPPSRDKILIYANPCLNSKHILASMNYFDSDMSKSTNTVVYFDWKMVIYIYVCGQCTHCEVTTAFIGVMSAAGVGEYTL
jgi:hypothetical protein